MPSPTLLSEVRFGAFLAYSPRGTSDVSRLSQLIRQRIKTDGPELRPQPHGPMIDAVVRLIQSRGGPDLAAFLHPDAVLVPLPRSAPFPPRQTNVLWVPQRIAGALVARGHGCRVASLLLRTTAVPKSAFAVPGQRPTPRMHFDSMELRRDFDTPDRIVLVDDFVTKGATFLAAASLIKTAFPQADVACFALVRTLGLQPNILRIVDPVVGTITLTQFGAADRQP